jgi:hypothetical protein
MIPPQKAICSIGSALPDYFIRWQYRIWIVLSDFARVLRDAKLIGGEKMYTAEELYHHWMSL